MVPLKVHNILDYVAGVFLLICPSLFGFYEIEAARYTFWVLGAGLIAYSAMTRYYYSVLKLIPVSVHMVLDASIGILLMLAPAAFGYRVYLTGSQYGLHFVLGLGLVGLVAVTDRTWQMVSSGKPHAAGMTR